MYRTCVAAALLLIACLSARADSFQYSLSDNIGDSVTYLSPTLVTSTTTVPSSSLQTCSLLGDTCENLTLFEGSAYDDFQLLVGSSNGGGDLNYFFAPGSFSNIGTYDTDSGTNQGHLAVTRFSAPAIAPEPSSFLLLCSGLFGTAALRRRQ